ncbi:MAG TPA: hypothetical protein VFO85_03785 [Vicinamibacteria bacterium]|nr:hypothetical protein [Vicinamibacteria bacterium]
MKVRGWLGVITLAVVAGAALVTSGSSGAKAAPRPDEVVVANLASEPVPVTGEVRIRGNGAGFSAKAGAIDTGPELLFYVNGPLAGAFGPIVIENASLQINAPSGRPITAILNVYPPDGQLEGAATTYLPLVPQGSFGLRTLYVANQALRLYSHPDPGSHVVFVVQCMGCDATETVSARGTISGQTNP